MIGAFRLTTLGKSTTPAWILRYYGSGADNAAGISSSCTDGLGNYYMMITTTSVTLIGTQDVLVVKVNAAGTVLWKTRIGKSASTYAPRGLVFSQGYVHAMIFQSNAQQVTLVALDASTGNVLASQYITTINSYNVTVMGNTSNSGLHLIKNSNSIGFTVTANTIAATSFCYTGSFTFNGSTYTNNTTGHGSNQTAYIETPWGSVFNANGYFAKVYVASSYVFISSNLTSSATSDTRYLNTIGSLADMCGSNESTSGCDLTFLSTSTNPVVTKLNTSSWSYTSKSLISSAGTCSAGRIYTSPDNSTTYMTMVFPGTVRAFYLVKLDASLNIVWQLKFSNSLTTVIPAMTSLTADTDSVYINSNFNFGAGGGIQGVDSVTFKLPADGSKIGAFTVGGSTWTIATTTDITTSNFTFTVTTLGSTDTGSLGFSTNNPFLSNSTNGLTTAITTV
jgi:hypothetical protein